MQREPLLLVKNTQHETHIGNNWNLLFQEGIAPPSGKIKTLPPLKK